jgi:hypothetical protein
MTTIIAFLIGAVGGFVFGVLFGRKNTQKVEKAVTTVESIGHKKD